MRTGGVMESPRPEPATEEVGRQFATVLQSDIHGFTSMTSQAEESIVREVRRHLTQFRKFIEESGGSIVTDRGDGWKAVFPSPVRTLEAALHMLEWSRQDNAEAKDRLPIRHRIGIHASDIVMVEGTVSGMAVAVAARLEQMAGPNEIIVSEEIDNIARSNLKYRRHFLGPVDIKGVPHSVRAYRIMPPVDQPLTDEELSGDAARAFFDGVKDEHRKNELSAIQKKYEEGDQRARTAYILVLLVIILGSFGAMGFQIYQSRQNEPNPTLPSSVETTSQADLEDKPIEIPKAEPDRTGFSNTNEDGRSRTRPLNQGTNDFVPDSSRPNGEQSIDVTPNFRPGGGNAQGDGTPIRQGDMPN
ncbi:MAG: adenylate/guanylate cyclase domain-containing protein [Fimbriimonadaceae bacterium]|nr:adenylate/guanylate cyclase domain-containing protein [Fimbriimonadaceae bacterium]